MMPTANIQNTFRLVLILFVALAAFVIIREFRARKTVRMTDGEGNTFTGEIKTHYFGGRRSRNRAMKVVPKTTEKASEEAA